MSRRCVPRYLCVGRPKCVGLGWFTVHFGDDIRETLIMFTEERQREQEELALVGFRGDSPVPAQHQPTYHTATPRLSQPVTRIIGGVKLTRNVARSVCLRRVGSGIEDISDFWPLQKSFAARFVCVLHRMLHISHIFVSLLVIKSGFIRNRIRVSRHRRLRVVTCVHSLPLVLSRRRD